MVKFYIPRFTLLMLFLFIAQIAPAFSAGSLSFNPEQGAIVPLEKGFGVAETAQGRDGGQDVAEGLPDLVNPRDDAADAEPLIARH